MALLLPKSNYMARDRYGSDAAQWAVSRGHVDVAKLIARHHEMNGGSVSWIRFGGEIGGIVLNDIPGTGRRPDGIPTYREGTE